HCPMNSQARTGTRTACGRNANSRMLACLLWNLFTPSGCFVGGEAFGPFLRLVFLQHAQMDVTEAMLCARIIQHGGRLRVLGCYLAIKVDKCAIAKSLRDRKRGSPR